jgi:hypothetical protein
MGGGSRSGTEVPKNPEPSAAVTGVLRLSSILPNFSAAMRTLVSGFSKEVSEDKFGGLLESRKGEDGGEVAMGGEKQRRLRETVGNTRAFFFSGTSGLVPGLGK